MSELKEMTRNSCNYPAPCLPTSTSSKSILADYKRGSFIAALMFAAMFAFMSFGVVVFGW